MHGESLIKMFASIPRGAQSSSKGRIDRDFHCDGAVNALGSLHLHHFPRPFDDSHSGPCFPQLSWCTLRAISGEEIEYCTVGVWRSFSPRFIQIDADKWEHSDHSRNRPFKSQLQSFVRLFIRTFRTRFSHRFLRIDKLPGNSSSRIQNNPTRSGSSSESRFEPQWEQ